MTRYCRALSRALAALSLLLAALALGCGPRNAPVDAAKAREVLRTALESWKKGEKSDALQKASPPVYVIDPDWQGGAALADYQVVGEGKEMDAHLFSTVKLTLRSPGGEEVRREVTFVVSTAPNLTVSRKLF